MMALCCTIGSLDWPAMTDNSRSDQRRVVPVPAMCRALHAVFTADPVEPVADIEAPPASLLRRFGADDDTVRRLERRRFGQLFATEAAPGAMTRALAETRAAALAAATASDGIVVDLGIPRIVTRPADDRAAASWVAADLADGVLRTRGLTAFGLPEVHIEPGDDQTSMVLAVLTGLVHRLLAEWPRHDPVGPAAVTLRDIAEGYGDADTASAPTTPALDLLIAYADDALTVTLLDDPAVLFT